MNEIEKMYENAEIRLIHINACKIDETEKNSKCNTFFYPDFTAEKQLELIKWLINSGECYFAITINPDEFEEYLAKYINNMWKDLADIDKKQIKEILK